MAGGKGKIHEHPKAGTNSFKHRPEDSGRNLGSTNRATDFQKYTSIVENAKNIITGEEEKLSQKDQIIIKLISDAKAGEKYAIEILFDGLYGKLTDKIQHGIDETVTPPIKWLD